MLALSSLCSPSGLTLPVFLLPQPPSCWNYRHVPAHFGGCLSCLNTVWQFLLKLNMPAVWSSNFISKFLFKRYEYVSSPKDFYKDDHSTVHLWEKQIPVKGHSTKYLPRVPQNCRTHPSRVWDITPAKRSLQKHSNSTHRQGRTSAENWGQPHTGTIAGCH